MAAPSGRYRFGSVLDCLGLLALAAVLRFLWLGYASLPIDELFSVCWSQLDLPFLLGEGARTETNPPGYYVLLHLWMEVFGTSEFAVRALSALASTAMVAVVYMIGRMVGGRRTAVLASVLVAVNPVAIGAGQEARAYALAALLDGVGLLALCRTAGDRAGRPLAWRRLAWLAVFVLSMVATAWLHYTSLFFVAACFGAIGWRLVTTRPFPTRDALIWVAAAVLTALPSIKLVRLAASLSGSNNLVWIGPMTAGSIESFFLDLATQLPQGGWFQTVSWVACGLMALIVVTALPRLRHNRPLGLVILVAVLYCGSFIAASWLRPMLLSRVARWLVIPFCLVLAQAAAELGGFRLKAPSDGSLRLGGQSTPEVPIAAGKRVRAQFHAWRWYAAAAVPLLTFLFSLGYFERFSDKEDWRQAARLVATQPRCTGPVLVSEFNALGLYYYGVWRYRAAYVFLPDPRRRDSVEFRLSERLMHLPELDPDAVAGFVHEHPGAVIIMRAEYATVIPLALQALVAGAPFNAKLDGGLTVACF